MLKSLTLIAAAVAIAGSAHAEERVFTSSVAVRLVGKSPSQISQDIRDAARDACRQAAAGAGPLRLTSDAECRARAIRTAKAFLRDHQIATASPSLVAAAN